MVETKAFQPAATRLTAQDALSTYKALPQDEKDIVNAVIGLGAPPPSYVGPIWLMLVGAFVVLLLGGTFVLYLLVTSGKETNVIVPLVTAAIGVLAGLMAPSPVVQSK